MGLLKEKGFTPEMAIAVGKAVFGGDSKKATDFFVSSTQRGLDANGLYKTALNNPNPAIKSALEPFFKAAEIVAKPNLQYSPGYASMVNKANTVPATQLIGSGQSDMERMQPEMYNSTPVKKEEPNFVQVDEYTKKYPEGQKFTPTVPKVEGKTTMTDGSNTIARAKSTIGDLNKKIDAINNQLNQYQKNGENSAKVITPLSNQLDELKKQKTAISLAMINKIDKEKYQPVINFVKQKMPGVANMFNL